MPRKSEPRTSGVSPSAPEDMSNARFALKDPYQDPGARASTTVEAPPPHALATAASMDPAPSKSASPERNKMSHPPPAAAQQEPVDDETEDEHPANKTADPNAMTIEDLTLPKSIITRLAKGVLPANTQIQANAVLAMSKSTTVFVNYLASNANDHTMSMGKKTIAPADVFKALEDVEFGFLKERLEAEYQKFNQIQTEKRTSYRAKVKAAKTGPSDSPNPDVSMADSAVPSTEDAPGHQAKKARVDPDSTMNTVEHDDAETEDEEPLREDDDEVDEGNEDEENEENEDEERRSEDGIRDGMEDRVRGEERDEALDGDDSD